jgi:hypothetical protein
LIIIPDDETWVMDTATCWNEGPTDEDSCSGCDVAGVAILLRAENKRQRELLKKVLAESKEHGGVSIYTIMDIEEALGRRCSHEQGD